MKVWKEKIRETGASLLFFFLVCKTFFKKGVRWDTLLRQVYAVGVQSIPITVVAGFFVGGILAIQIHLQLRDFGAEGFLGGLSTSVTLRNLGPVLIAFLLSGKVGAYTSAELGSMKITDQISALRCLGVDPIEYIIVPRFIAVTLSSFLLLILGLGVSVFGGTVVAALDIGVSTDSYLSNIAKFVTLFSVVIGVFKSLVFGAMIAAISCYEGYQTTGGTVGVGVSVRRASVLALVSIVTCDLVISVFSGGLWSLGVGR